MFDKIPPTTLAVLLALAACSKHEPPPATETKVEASADKKAAVDPKIASVMAAAEASAESTPPSGRGAPPPDGVLGSEAAASELAPGSATELTLGGAGNEPRVRLGAERITPGAGPAGKLTVSYRAGGSAMPTIECDLKPKASAAGVETQPASIPPGGSPAGQLALRFAFSAVRPAADQPGRLPEDARAEIAKLNGSYVELIAEPGGALVSQHQKLAGDNPDLEPLLASSAEALAGAILPYPDVPVGVGAFWMLKSREFADGAPVIAYRMVKLTELSPTLAKLSINTRRYLIERTLPTPGLPPHQVRRYESAGEGTLSLKPGAAYPESAESRDTFMALVSPDDRPNQPVPVRSELSTKLSFQR